MAGARNFRAPEKTTISFQVVAKNDPELAAWLRELEWGNKSKAIRKVLSLAAQINARKDNPELTEAIRALHASQGGGSKLAPAPAPVPPVPPAASAVRPAVNASQPAKPTSSSEVASPGEIKLAAAAAAAMLDMDDRFN